MLEIKNLHAEVDGVEILKGVDLKINPGEVHAIMGPNGSGKSTLANVVMGNPVYEISKGNIIFEGEDITEEPVDNRAKLGMFLAFQYPESIPGVTIVNMLKTLSPFHSKPNVNYPFEKEKVAPRARGVIALDQEACTSCMLCARQCPDWCIYIEGHKELQPPSKPGGRQRSRAVLDRFDIDYALCMYCGICVEVCPFDALFWSPEYEYSEFNMGDMLHDKERLDDWLKTVPEAEGLES